MTLVNYLQLDINKPYTVYVEIFAWRKLSPISPSVLTGETFITQIICPVLVIT